MRSYNFSSENADEMTLLEICAQEVKERHAIKQEKHSRCT